MITKRVTGDILDVIFAPDGSLASARLEGIEVSGYLKGINEENAATYLQALGFRKQWQSIELASADFFQGFLPDGELIESCVKHSSNEFMVTIIAESDRNLPCPTPKRKLLCRQDGFPLNIL